MFQCDDDDELAELVDDHSNDEEAEPGPETAQRGSSSDMSHSHIRCVSPGHPGTSCTTTNRVKRKRLDKTTKKKTNVSEVLADMLVENRQKDKELDAKVNLLWYTVFLLFLVKIIIHICCHISICFNNI